MNLRFESRGDQKRKYNLTPVSRPAYVGFSGGKKILKQPVERQKPRKIGRYNFNIEIFFLISLIECEGDLLRKSDVTLFNYNKESMMISTFCEGDDTFIMKKELSSGQNLLERLQCHHD